MNLDIAIVKRKSHDVGKSLKSSLRKRQQPFGHSVSQPVAKFVNDGSGDSAVVQNKQLCLEPSKLVFSHAAASTSEVTGLPSSGTGTHTMHSSVLHAENETVSNVISTSMSGELQLTNRAAVSNMLGTVLVTSGSNPKVTETSARRKNIQHLKFSSAPVTAAESVASTVGRSHRQAAAAANQAPRVQTTETVTAQRNTITDCIYLLWPNEDSLCWLDVTMALIVNCESLRSTMTQLDKASCLSRLLTSFDSAQVNFRQSRKLFRCHYLCGQGKAVTLETSVGQVTVKTGGGRGPATTSLLGGGSAVISNVDLDDISSIISATDPHSASLEKVSEEAKRLEDKAKQLMVQIRDDVFQSLEPRMHCERGKCDSVLIALTEILSLYEPVKSYFNVHYAYSLLCTCCGQPESGT